MMLTSTIEELLFQDRDDFITAEIVGYRQYLINDEVVTAEELKELEEKESIKIIFIEWR